MSETPPPDSTTQDSSTRDSIGAPVLSLRAFGTLLVEPAGAVSPDEAARSRWHAEVLELSRRRRKVALLVYLHGSTRPVSRDLLMELLWPDDEPERARHSLNEALSHLRRVLGRDALGARGGDVKLATDVPLLSDVHRFEDAVRRGRAVDAIALYAGPFLDGVFIDRAPRFELWVANERERLRQALVSACQAVCATECTVHTAPQHAVAARKWLDASPGSEDAARAWITALTVAGTPDALRAGLAAYEQIVREVRVEDDEPLAPSLQQLGARLRERVAETEAVARETLVETALAGTARADGARAGTAQAETAQAETARAETTHVVDAPRRSGRRWWLAGVAALLTAMTLWWGARTLGSGATPSSESAERPWVLLAPVAVSGVVDSTNMSGALGVAFASALSRTTLVDVVDPSRVAATLTRMQQPDSALRNERTVLEAAERIGASVVVFPEAATLGARSVLRVRLLTAQGTDAAPPAERQLRAGDDWLRAVDGVVRDMIDHLVRTAPAADRTASAASALPAVTTTSLPALRAYAAAQQAQRRTAWADAEQSLRLAVSLDSSFAQGWSALGALYSLLNRPRDADEAFTRALAVAAPLAERERLLVRAAVLREQRQFDAAARELSSWMLTHPRDREVGAVYADVLWLRGDRAAARTAYRSLIAADSLDPALWWNYASAFDTDGPTAMFDSIAHAYSQAARLDSAVITDAVFNHQWGAALARAGRTDSAARLFSRMLSQPASLRARGLRSLAHLAIWQQRPAQAIPLLREALPLEERAKAGATTVVRTRLLLAVMLDRAGDSLAARVQRDSVVQRAEQLGLQEPLLYYLLGKEQVRRAQLREARMTMARVQRVLVPANRRHQAMRLLMQAELDAAGAQWGAARARADSGIALDSTTLTLDTRAYVLRRYAEWLASTRSDANMLATARREARDADLLLAARREFGWEGTLVSAEARARLAGGTASAPEK